RNLLAIKIACGNKVRACSTEDTKIVINRVHFIVIHDCEADIPCSQTARGKGIADQSALSKLHGGRRINQGPIKVHNILAHLGLGQVNVGNQSEIVQNLNGTLSLRALSHGIASNLNEVFPIRAEDVPHEEETCLLEADCGDFRIRPIDTVITKHTDDVREIFRIARIPPGVVPIALCEFDIQPSTDLQEERLVVGSKINPPVVPKLEGRLTEISLFLEIPSQRCIPLLGDAPFCESII